MDCLRRAIYRLINGLWAPQSRVLSHNWKCTAIRFSIVFLKARSCSRKSVRDFWDNSSNGGVVIGRFCFDSATAVINKTNIRTNIWRSPPLSPVCFKYLQRVLKFLFFKSRLSRAAAQPQIFDSIYLSTSNWAKSFRITNTKVSQLYSNLYTFHQCNV